MKRDVELVVISDVHLGTYGCRSRELMQYLSSINPKKLVLNGDIIDIWQFRKSYFPESHLGVLKHILDLAYQDCEVTYITGNHDEMLRKFGKMQFGNIALTNRLLLELNGKKVWIFHGDVFDASIQHTKWLAKLGGWGYDRLIQLNNIINWMLLGIGREKYSLSKQIKNSVKKAVRFITDFEETASHLAIENLYDYVICGHIHQPQIRTVETKKGSCVYLNSGDWIENLTALEYNNGEWSMFHYEEHKHTLGEYKENAVAFRQNVEQLLNNIITDQR
ncbi:MAG: UDP-2,3-diacylglucosamine diphosphatase [Sphingobacterium sp.]|uniref:UDP-2,3-diacylglucosamine diphosphatase n=1 Tax=Sphingobacterium sp. JB170 TaxID=1434842 RepID=UPI00097F1D86|nr:UDP-2,3-diacylglucosamine diphosphatase [Sphingobacterium sp. JB170]SJN47430.1 Ser/Thr protein phosphatase family protein, UDP-2,3-diacylglucosamine hydrolase homolog [Sphingobacterium sp. JB170]